MVANNGVGKTSLLKILTENDEADRGEVTKKKGLRIGYLEQQPSLNQDSSINEFFIGVSSPK